MFKNCSVMVIGAEEPKPIMRLEVDRGTQDAICKSFSDAVEALTNNKEKVEFDGCYTPEQDEFLYINGFQMADEIKDAIRNPLGVAAFEKSHGDYPNIKAIFVGIRREEDGKEKFSVAFQRFRKEQYISPQNINLFFSGNTFRREENYGISISDCIDCYYTDDELQFVSYYFARQVFDLSGYYRSATNSEVTAFTSNEHLSFENAESFEVMANTSIRRKIAMINDSGVLKDHTATEIQKLALQVGIEITTDDQKIIIPNNKEQVKIILGFLDEEAFKGPFSQTTFLANSKKKISRN